MLFYALEREALRDTNIILMFRCLSRIAVFMVGQKHSHGPELIDYEGLEKT
jgi:hypothetical protein